MLVACLLGRASLSHAESSSIQQALDQVNSNGPEHYPSTATPLHGQEANDGLRVHNLFQSNMVVQRDKPIVVWGWSNPGDAVTVTFAQEHNQTTTASDGTWRVTLPAMPANSKPLQMTIRDNVKTLTLDNLLLGDVWIVGGQSNMQLPLSRVEGGTVEIASANIPELRLLTIPSIVDHVEKKNFLRREGEKQPDGDWDVSSPKTVPDFSAIGFVFAHRLQMATQVPIGVIDISHFGTTVEAWTPLSMLKSMDSEVVNTVLTDWDKQVATWDPKKNQENRIKRYNQKIEELKKQGKNSNEKPPSDLLPGPVDNQNYPGNCYASMLAPIAGFPVKGAIFHQGFNNARDDAADFYGQVFPKMIDSWRAAFHDAKLPFGIISLCTDGPPQTLDNYVESMLNLGIYVREAQYKTFLNYYKAGDKNIGFASSYDLRRAWYHPQNKIPAGERIARWALATQYGLERTISWKPPMITQMENRDGNIILHFDNEVASVDSQAIAGFAIAGEDKKYEPAQAEALVTGKDAKGEPLYDHTVLVLSSPDVSKPTQFRYAWGRNPMGNLRINNTDERDISLATQRSDDWKFWEVPYIAPPADQGKSRASLDKIREALKFIDLERRVMDAERTLKAEKPRYEELKKTFK